MPGLIGMFRLPLPVIPVPSTLSSPLANPIPSFALMPLVLWCAALPSPAEPKNPVPSAGPIVIDVYSSSCATPTVPPRPHVAVTLACQPSGRSIGIGADGAGSGWATSSSV